MPTGHGFFTKSRLLTLRRSLPRQRVRNIRKWEAQGAIVLQGRLPEVKRLRIPTVVSIETRRLDRSYFQIVCANEEVGRLGARILAGLGLRHFAYCGLDGLEFSDNRRAGFLQGIQEAGFSAAIYSSSRRNPWPVLVHRGKASWPLVVVSSQTYRPYGLQ